MESGEKVVAVTHKHHKLDVDKPTLSSSVQKCPDSAVICEITV